MGKITEKEKLMIERLDKLIYTNGVSKEFLIQLFELSGRYLNIKTISDYAKENKMSYNGVKKFRGIKEMFGVKFVIEK
jgi:hypothetical protein